MSDRLKLVVGVHLVLRQNNKILLARRHNTGFADGCYNFPCGHLDPDESILNAMVREAEEEVGIKLLEKDLSLVGISHWQSSKQSVNLFFECCQWSGNPINNEPDKCDDLSWFSLDHLPEMMVDQTKKILEEYRTAPLLNLKAIFIDNLQSV